MGVLIEDVELYGLSPEVKYTLISDMTNKSIQINLPPQIRQTEENLKKRLLMKKEIFNELVRFSETIKKRMPHFNLTTFYNNTKTIKVRNFNKKRGEFIGKHIGMNGGYFPTSNLIVIYSNNLKKVLPHELFHVSTTYKDENGIEYSGFCQKDHNTKEEVGRAITEGYTSLINRRYFPETNNGYEMYRSIMEIVEEEIGQENMETLFSKMDMHGLLKKTEEHGFYEPFIDIIKSTDFFELHYAERSDPLRFYKPEYEGLSNDEKEKIFTEKDEKREVVEKRFNQAIEKFIIIIAKNKIKRNEMNLDEATNWAKEKNLNFQMLNTILSTYQTSEYSFINLNSEKIGGKL